MSLLLTGIHTIEQASVRNDEDGGVLARSRKVSSPSDRSVPPLSTLLSLLEQASVRNDEVAATTRLMGGAGALPQGQQFIFGEVL